MNMGERTDYSDWNRSQLLERIGELESRLEKSGSRSVPSTTAPAGTSPDARPSRSTSKRVKPRHARVFDPSRYTTRLIALKFAYLGQKYNGFEHHANNKTPLPTIEGELWRALVKTKLIFPKSQDGNIIGSPDAEISWEGCEYSKCGRTDKGVSAFGQVIGLRVRSNRPLQTSKNPAPTNASERLEHVKSRKTSLDTVNEPTDLRDDEEGSSLAQMVVEMEDVAMEDAPQAKPSFDPITDELPYIQLLNRVLPNDIRILAWCPAPPPEFSARFSCRERRYRYFFTQPAFAPVPGSAGLVDTISGAPSREGWLDIAAMREAAEHYVGLYDFRNFCKLDPSKQIMNFERRIFRAEIEELNPLKEPLGFVSHPGLSPWPANSKPSSTLRPFTEAAEIPKAYSFNIYGSAFLWHQVRHLVAVLFLVGQGLEKPSVVADMLDVTKTPTKPHYDMADDAPLVLWDCIFPAEGAESREDALEWIYAGDTPTAPGSAQSDAGDSKYGRGGVIDDLWQIWRNKKIDEILAGKLIDVVAEQGKKLLDPPSRRLIKPKSIQVFGGGDTARAVGSYVPILERRRLESYETVNARYAAKKGLDMAKAAAVEDETNE